MPKLFILPFASPADLEATVSAVSQAIPSDVLLGDLSPTEQASLWDVERVAGDFYVFGRGNLGRGNLPGRKDTWARVSAGDVLLLATEGRYRYGFRILAKVAEKLADRMLEGADRRRSVGSPAFLVSEPEPVDRSVMSSIATTAGPGNALGEVPEAAIRALENSHGSLDSFLRDAVGAERTASSSLPTEEAVPPLTESPRRSAKRAPGPQLPPGEEDPELRERLLAKKRRRSRAVPSLDLEFDLDSGVVLGALATARRVAVDAALLLCAVLLMVGLVRGLFVERLWIDPISVPEQIASEGFGSGFVAMQLADAVGEIRGAVEARRDVGLLGSWDVGEPLPTASAGSFEHTLAGLRGFVGSPDPHVRGGIAQRAGELAMTIQLADLGGVSVRGGQYDAALIEKAAESIVKLAEPVLYSSYLTLSAEEELLEKRYAEAERRAREALELAPDQAYAEVVWGASQAGLGNPEAAIEHYEKAERYNPKLPILHRRWAEAELALGETARAEERFALAVTGETGSATWLTEWAELLREQGAYQEAQRHLERATELEPTRASAWNNWGLVLRAQGDFTGALAKYRRAAELDPANAQIYYNWGNALNAMKQYEDAIEKYSAASQRDPEFAPVRNNWGVALASTGNHLGAIEQYRTAVQLDPDYTEAISNWGLALHELEEFEAAEERFAAASEVDPNSAAVYYNWGRALHARRRIDEAVAKYERAMELDPESFAFVGNRIETMRAAR